MKAILLAPVLLFSALTFAPASAAPVAPLHGAAAAVEQPLIQVQHGRRQDSRHDSRRDARRHYRPAPRYRAGHRYRSAPHGWHRYDRRPGDWSRRGCIMVGPLWFCP